MADPSSEVTLPASVELMLQRICLEQCQPPPETNARRTLDIIGEENSLHILNIISTNTIKKSFDGYIVRLAKNHLEGSTQQTVNQSAKKRSSSSCNSPVNCPSTDGIGSPSPKSHSPSSILERESIQKFSPQLLALFKLEFRNMLEDLMSADDILALKDLPMRTFESEVWAASGQHCCEETDRQKYLDLDSGKTHLCHCHVHQDGSNTCKMDPMQDGFCTNVMKLLEEMKEERKKMNEKKIQMLEIFYLQEREKLALEREKLALEKEKLAQEKEKLKLEQSKEEERIMSMNTSKMHPSQKEYINRRQWEILGLL